MNRISLSLSLTTLLLLTLVIAGLGCPPQTDPDQDPTDLVSVPNVVGMQEADAVVAIEDAGLIAGTITEEYSDHVPAGAVIAQVPEAGAEVEPETEVNLLVSLGQAPDGDTHTIYLPGNVPLELVRIPAGTFMMGSPEGEQDRFDSEGSQHQRTIDAFWMGKYTVTKQQWEAVMGTRPWEGEDWVLDHPDSPAVYISWNDAHDFISALNQHIAQTDQGPGNVRLPSEAEWEYTARAGTTTRFYWGDDPNYTMIDDYAWYRDNREGLYAHVVGQKLPNAWGLYDMAGNVWEWCEDDWHSNYEGAPSDGSAWIDSPRGSFRVFRGGSWSDSPRYCRSAYRNGFRPTGRLIYSGFRVAFP